MSEKLMGATVRDLRNGMTGRVVGIVTWDHGVTRSLIVQPPVRADATVPPTAYVPEPAAEIVPQANESRLPQ